MNLGKADLGLSDFLDRCKQQGIEIKEEIDDERSMRYRVDSFPTRDGEINVVARIKDGMVDMVTARNKDGLRGSGGIGYDPIDETYHLYHFNTKDINRFQYGIRFHYGIIFVKEGLNAILSGNVGYEFSEALEGVPPLEGLVSGLFYPYMVTVNYSGNSNNPNYYTDNNSIPREFNFSFASWDFLNWDFLNFSKAQNRAYVNEDNPHLKVEESEMQLEENNDLTLIHSGQKYLLEAKQVLTFSSHLELIHPPRIHRDPNFSYPLNIREVW